MTLFGRAVLAGRWGIGQQFIAGWGCFCIALTLWGVVTPASLRLPAIGFVCLSFGAVFLKSRMGTWRDDLPGLWRLLILSLPLLWIMADIDVSQMDVYNLMLPNMAYLFDHNHFPTQDGPPAFSDLPVAPYNTEIVPYLGTLAGGGFSANSLSLFTLLLHLPAALLFARVISGPGKQMGWFALSFGFALATLLNPGFVPRISFSGMGEAPLAITLLFSGWLIVGVMEDLAAGIRWPSRLVPLALTLAAMINVKQQAIGVFVALVAGVFMVSACDRRIGWRRGGMAFGAALLPAVLLFLLWRGYVLTAYPLGELKPNPLSAWVWNLIPKILLRMGQVLLEKGYFTASLIALFFFWVRPKDWMSTTTKSLCALTGWTAITFNIYLLMTFIGHFNGEHSYFRYNTELTLLIDLALLCTARDKMATCSIDWSRWKKAATIVLIALMTVTPLVFSQLLRFDRDMPQPRLRFFVDKIAQNLNGAERIAIMLPQDNNTADIAVGGLLRFGARYHPVVDIEFTSSAAPADFDRVAKAGYSLAVVSCTTISSLKGDFPADAAVLFALSDNQWKPVQVWPYPAKSTRSKWGWTRFVAHEPFCLD